MNEVIQNKVIHLLYEAPQSHQGQPDSEFHLATRIRNAYSGVLNLSVLTKHLDSLKT